MSVIIRLQNLPWSANSLDVRQFFRGLSIPEGGVHIVGGEMGDAFIAFSTDEDARQAMMLQGGKIKEVQVSLLLSSRSEMQKVIEQARQASMNNSLAQLLVPQVPATPIVTPPVQVPERRESLEEKSDRRKRRSRSGSKERERDRTRGDRRDRGDRERDRRRRSRSRSRERDRTGRRRRSRSRDRDANKEREKKDNKIEPTTIPPLNTPLMPVVTQTVAHTLPQATQPLNNWLPLQPTASPYLANTMPYGMLSQAALLQQQQQPLMPMMPGLNKDAMKGDIPSRDPRSSRLDPPLKPGGGSLLSAPFGIPNNQFSTPVIPNREMIPARDVDTRPADFDSRMTLPPNRPLMGDLPMNNRFGGGPPRDMNPFNNDRNNSNNGFNRGPDRRNFRGNDNFNDGDNFGNEEFEEDEGGVDEFGRNRRRMGRDDFEHRGPSNFQNRFGMNGPPRNRGDNWGPRGGGPGGPPDDRRFSQERDGRPPFRPREDRFRRRDDERFSREKRGDDDGEKLQDCCVNVTKVPINAVYGDVRRGFHIFGVHIDSIKFNNDDSNYKKALVRFAKPEDKKKVIQSMRKVYICEEEVKISHLKDEDYDKAPDEFVRRTEKDASEKLLISPDEDCLQVCNLPPPFSDMDLRAMFPTYELTNLFVLNSGNILNGFVRFAKASDCQSALQTRNRVCRNVPVLLTPVSRKVFNEKLAEKQAREKKEEEIKKQQQQDGFVSDVVLMKNLPPAANDRDICDFFSDVGLVPLRIHLMLDRNSTPSGDAFCEFSDTEKSKIAVTKNGSPMGQNIIQLTLVPRSDLNMALGLPNSEQMQNEDEGTIVLLENIPYAANEHEILRFFGPSYDITLDDIERNYNERGLKTGEAKVRLRSPQDAMRAMETLNFRRIRERPVRLNLA